MRKHATRFIQRRCVKIHHFNPTFIMDIWSRVLNQTYLWRMPIYECIKTPSINCPISNYKRTAHNIIYLMEILLIILLRLKFVIKQNVIFSPPKSIDHPMILKLKWCTMKSLLNIKSKQKVNTKNMNRIKIHIHTHTQKTIELT